MQIDGDGLADAGRLEDPELDQFPLDDGGLNIIPVLQRVGGVWWQGVAFRPLVVELWRRRRERQIAGRARAVVLGVGVVLDVVVANAGDAGLCRAAELVQLGQ